MEFIGCPVKHFSVLYAPTRLSRYEPKKLGLLKKFIRFSLKWLRNAANTGSSRSKMGAEIRDFPLSAPFVLANG
jgi:hypothetical protein